LTFGFGLRYSLGDEKNRFSSSNALSKEVTESYSIISSSATPRFESHQASTTNIKRALLDNSLIKEVY